MIANKAFRFTQVNQCRTTGAVRGWVVMRAQNVLTSTRRHSMNLFDQQQIEGCGRGLDRKDRQIAALKGVITKLKKRIAKLEAKSDEN